MTNMPPRYSSQADEVEALRAYAYEHGAIMAVSGHFCPEGTYWADLIRPGYATLATAASPVEAAMAAIAQFERDHLPT
jgi:hypothetical protein